MFFIDLGELVKITIFLKYLLITFQSKKNLKQMRTFSKWGVVFNSKINFFNPFFSYLVFSIIYILNEKKIKADFNPKSKKM